MTERVVFNKEINTRIKKLQVKEKEIFETPEEGSEAL